MFTVTLLLFVLTPDLVFGSEVVIVPLVESGQCNTEIVADEGDILVSETVKREFGKMEFSLFCPQRYLPKTCHICGFGTKLKGLKVFVAKTSEENEELIAGCSTRIVNINDNPLKELPMTVVCSPRAIPDPCNLVKSNSIQAHHVHFMRSRTATVQCNPGFVMQSCALSIIAPTMDWIQMELNDDTGLLPIVNNSCSIKDCVYEGANARGVPHDCAIQAVCLPDKDNPTAMCTACDEAQCAAQNLTCGRVPVKQNGHVLMCVNETTICNPDSLFGYNCAFCLRGIPVYCTDKDECKENPGMCGDGECTNTDGGYQCECKEGPCQSEGCTDALCGNNSCYQQTNDTVTHTVCGEESALIVVKEVGDMAVLECTGLLYMKIDAWFVGEKKLRQATATTRTHVINRKKLKEETMVTCQLRSRWFGKIVRHSVLVQPIIKRDKESKNKKKSDTGKKKKKSDNRKKKNKESKGKSKGKNSKKSKKGKD